MSKETTKVALVTGASRGIGAAIAERLGRDGFGVVVGYAGKVREAEAVARRITEAGGKAGTVQADVADPAAVSRMFDATEAAFGSIDVVVNSAGLMKLAPLAETTDALFDSHVAVNLKGAFNVMREATRRVRKGGRIITMSSSMVGIRQPTYAVYAATKAGVEAMTHIVAKELRGRNITVNAVAPGPTATELFLDGKPAALIETFRKLAPLERLGQPDDVANVVSFLAGPDGGWVNGQVLRTNGGVI